MRFSIRQKWLGRNLLLMYKSTRSIDLIDHHISIHVVGGFCPLQSFHFFSDQNKGGRRSGGLTL